MPQRHVMAGIWLSIERLVCGLRQRSATVDGMTMPYLEGGSGPTLLLIHGFGGDGYNFTRVAARLRKHFRIVIPDLPGFGNASKHPDGAYDIRSQADHIAHFMETVGIDSAHIGGSSMGGFIAAQLAIQHPAKAKSLWLLNALGCPAALNSELYARFKTTGKLSLIIRNAQDFDEALDFVTFKKLAFPKSLKKMFLERAIQNSPLHERISRHLSDDATNLIKQGVKVMQPTLIVWGEKDRVLSPSCIPEQQEVFPNHVVKVMPQVGHLPMMEDSEKTARDYLSFIQGLTA